MEGKKDYSEAMLKETAGSAVGYEEPETNLEDDLTLFFSEYMGGGFDGL